MHIYAHTYRLIFIHTYIDIHTCPNICTRKPTYPIHILTYPHIFTRTRVDRLTYTHTYAYIYIHIHTNTLTPTHKIAHICVQKYTLAYTQIYIYIQEDIHTYIYKLTRNKVPTQNSKRWSNVANNTIRK